MRPAGRSLEACLPIAFIGFPTGCLEHHLREKLDVKNREPDRFLDEVRVRRQVRAPEDKAIRGPGDPKG